MRVRAVQAQVLYDLRKAWEFCSGTDLHEFLREQCDDPSPHGDTEIDAANAKQFIEVCLDTRRHNSPSLETHCQGCSALARLCNL